MNRPSSVVLLFGILMACTPWTKNSTAGENFRSLSQEQAFWNTWFDEHDDHVCPMEPILLKYKDGKNSEEILFQRMNEQLAVLNKSSTAFVLVARLNRENGITDFYALAKNGHWQLVQWKYEDRKGMEECAVRTPIIQERLLEKLSDEPVVVDVSESECSFDADSVYVFVRYGQACNRYAVYFPVYEHLEQLNENTVMENVTLLLWKLGIAEDGHDPGHIAYKIWKSTGSIMEAKKYLENNDKEDRSVPRVKSAPMRHSVFFPRICGIHKHLPGFLFRSINRENR